VAQRRGTQHAWFWRDGVERFTAAINGLFSTSALAAEVTLLPRLHFFRSLLRFHPMGIRWPSETGGWLSVHPFPRHLSTRDSRPNHAFDVACPRAHAKRLLDVDSWPPSNRNPLPIIHQSGQHRAARRREHVRAVVLGRVSLWRGRPITKGSGTMALSRGC